jgi:hypothetical protein
MIILIDYHYIKVVFPFPMILQFTLGQIIYYVTDLKNVPLLDYGGVGTQRHLVLDSEGQPGNRPPTKR